MYFPLNEVLENLNLFNRKHGLGVRLISLKEMGQKALGSAQVLWKKRQRFVSASNYDQEIQNLLLQREFLLLLLKESQQNLAFCSSHRDGLKYGLDRLLELNKISPEDKFIFLSLALSIAEEESKEPFNCPDILGPKTEFTQAFVSE